MDVSLLLSLGEGLVVERVEHDAMTLTVFVASTALAATCPLCQEPSAHLHSHYQRMVTDLPCGGRQVRLLVRVPKFRCKTPTCPHKVFAERLAPLIETWARQTTRLAQALQAIGLATCGEGGARLAARLTLPTSPTTLLRRIMALPTAATPSVCELGIDDFSFRRGRKFGTILVDLERHQILDVLPDRTSATAAAWMQQHPEIELVSRDRGGDYAAAARLGAPQAVQCADRFHLYKNLVEAVELILARCRAEIRTNARAALQKDLQEEAPEPLLFEYAEVLCVENWKPVPELCDERARLTRREQRYDRYQQVMTLYKQGLGFTEIAGQVGLSRRTIERWIKAGNFPETKRRRKRRSVFDPYAAYVLSRWEQGCTNGLQLWQEIKAQGYPGSAQTVYRFLRSLRQKRRIIWKSETPSAPLQDFSAHEAVWLFARDPASLEEQEQITLTRICQASQTAQTTYQVVQAFRQMLHQRQGGKLDEWLAAVHASGIRELQSFALGVDRDKAAVVAGLSLPQNNGMVEGFVTKVKLIKRTMYGRAGFALLRQRILHAA